MRALGELFDHPPILKATRRFLADPTHHLLVAYAPDEEPLGFITGVEVTHPDKGTEMFVYELAVVPHARRRGVGRTLVEALSDLARVQGCYGMWVLVDADNDPALATYRAAGGRPTARPVMIDWDLQRGRKRPATAG